MILPHLIHRDFDLTLTDSDGVAVRGKLTDHDRVLIKANLPVIVQALKEAKRLAKKAIDAASSRSRKGATGRIGTGK